MSNSASDLSQIRRTRSEAPPMDDNNSVDQIPKQKRVKRNSSSVLGIPPRCANVPCDVTQTIFKLFRSTTRELRQISVIVQEDTSESFPVDSLQKSIDNLREGTTAMIECIQPFEGFESSISNLNVTMTKLTSHLEVRFRCTAYFLI